METDLFTNESRSTKIHLIIYLILQISAAILIITSYLLYWIRYCVFDFGLYHTQDIYKNVDFHEHNISDLKEDCDNGELSNLVFEYKDKVYSLDIEDICRGFCDNVDKIYNANYAMFILTWITLGLICLNGLVVLMRLLEPMYRPFYLPIALGIFSFLTYFAGICTYLVVGDFYEYKGCDDYLINCEDFQPLEGVFIGIISVCLLFVVNFYGILFTRKAYTYP